MFELYLFFLLSVSAFFLLIPQNDDPALSISVLVRLSASLRLVELRPPAFVHFFPAAAHECSAPQKKKKEGKQVQRPASWEGELRSLLLAASCSASAAS